MVAMAVIIHTRLDFTLPTTAQDEMMMMMMMMMMSGDNDNQL